MQEAFVRKLDQVRHELGRPIHITSGYRCPAYNAKISSTGRTGPHTTGLAADLALKGEIARDALVLLCDYFEGIGINQKGEWEQRFIHVDDLDPRLWTY